MPLPSATSAQSNSNHNCIVIAIIVLNRFEPGELTMFYMPHSIFDVIGSVLSLLSTLIFVEVIVSYLVMYGKLSAYSPFVRTLRKIVDPLLNPVRRIMPRTGPMDFSPLIVMIALQFLSGLFHSF
jgi:YggT family protein